MTAVLRHLGDPNRAFWLTRSVARAVGVSLSEAIAEGALLPAEYSEMVTRCRKCPHGATCELWLAKHGAGAAEVPDYCANAQRLNGLIPARRPARA